MIAVNLRYGPSLHMIAMIATVLSALLTHDCLELLAEYPTGLWIFHICSFHQRAVAKVQGRIYICINIKDRSVQRVRAKRKRRNKEKEKEKKERKIPRKAEN
jgi:hypothetical protein